MVGPESAVTVIELLPHKKDNCRNLNYIVWYLFDQLMFIVHQFGTEHHFCRKYTAPKMKLEYDVHTNQSH